MSLLTILFFNLLTTKNIISVLQLLFCHLQMFFNLNQDKILSFETLLFGKELTVYSIDICFKTSTTDCF